MLDEGLPSSKLFLAVEPASPPLAQGVGLNRLVTRARPRSAVCSSVGLEEIEYYFRPPNQPMHMQPWLASVWRVPRSAC